MNSHHFQFLPCAHDKVYYCEACKVVHCDLCNATFELVRGEGRYLTTPEEFFEEAEKEINRPRL